MHIMSNDRWIEKIMEFYSYFMSYEQNECKKEYIKLLEKHDTFKTQLFDCKFDEKKVEKILIIFRWNAFWDLNKKEFKFLI